MSAEKAVLSALGRSAGWEIRPCMVCGQDAKYPANMVRNSPFEKIPAICDGCEIASRDGADQRIKRFEPKRLIERSGIPPMPSISIHPALKSFPDAKRSGVFLCGPPGSGKTSTAVSAIRAWCTKGLRCLYVTERQYFQAHFDRDNSLIRRAQQMPFVVFDDLGTDKQSEWSAGVFFGLVDERYRHRRKTVFISNHTLSELAGEDGGGGFQHFDDRVKRRVADMCGPSIMIKGGKR